SYRLNDRWLRELSMFSSRGYTTGMFFGKQPDGDYNFDGESYRMSHELVGVILDVKGNIAKVGLRNRLDIGDPLEYISPGLEEKLFPLESMKNSDGTDVATARNEETVFIQVPEGVRKNDLVRRSKNFRALAETVTCP
ncbi:MAG TPA: U32 family peptidase C-terminal domain-containing protein, partial [Thermodesulfovibrionales bacterium]|nr:U32 family peptidase C-terminal domain-containing protein [Thermodesulfovibrionales bacterium]